MNNGNNVTDVSNSDSENGTGAQFVDWKINHPSPIFGILTNEEG